MKINEPAREGFLYQIWCHKRFKNKTFLTVDGKCLRILEKGIRNYDSGPDFLNALISIEGNILRGDIEIHAIAKDWYAHEHHLDPKYNNVILHVVTMECSTDFKTKSQDNRIIPNFNLDKYMQRPAEQMESETPELYQSKNNQDIDCELNKENPIDIVQVLEKAGDIRFNTKVNQCLERREFAEWNQIFYELLLKSLGYSKNAISMYNLAINLPCETLWDYIDQNGKREAILKCEGCLFGAAGLLPQRATNNYIKELKRAWTLFPYKTQVDTLSAEKWKFFRLRPQNFPTRRLAAAARLIYKFRGQGFIKTLYSGLTDSGLFDYFLVGTDGYWVHNYHLENIELRDNKKEDAFLVGRDRAKTIVLNVVLPVLIAFALETEDGYLKNMIREKYSNFPSIVQNEITRTMKKRLTALSTIKIRARHQQGMLFLYSNFCKKHQCFKCIQYLDSK